MLDVCLRYASDENQAHQMLQEGFVNVYKKIKSYKSSGVFEPWLKMVVIETAILHIRNDKNQRMIVSTVHENKGTYKHKQSEITDEVIINSISKGDMLKGLQSLTSGYRIAYNLFLIDGFSHEQIADILNVSPEISKTNFEKARFAFRKNLIQYVNVDAK